jgi:glycosyltransferase involved in cell wall biosynthesis
MEGVARLDHIVVSDGPDPWLRVEMVQRAGWRVPVRYSELADHQEPHDLGSRARNHGVDLAGGEYVAFLDDDNAWRPRHVELLTSALETTGADFAYSQGLFHMNGWDMVVGMDPPRHGQIDTSLIMCRRELAIAYPWPSPCSRASDWELVHRWIREGATWAFVPQVTMDYYLGAER